MNCRLEWQIRYDSRIDVDEFPGLMLGEQMTTAFLAPFPKAERRLLITADLIGTLCNLNGLWRP
jgi:hypothetical protein